MMQEDYVTFEQAKLLKEKGFNIPCYTFYDIAFPKDGKPQFISSPYCHNHNVNPDYDAIVSAPTLSLVAKWLREEKNIFLEITIGGLKSYSCDIIILAEYNLEDRIKCERKYGQTYEEALSSGITKALELI